MKNGDIKSDDPPPNIKRDPIRDVDSLLADQLFLWLCEGALPNRDGLGIVGDMCEKLVAAGVPISRFALFIFTIHPTIRGRRISWSPENGATMISTGYDVFSTDTYFNNPIPYVLENQKSVRRKLFDPDCPDDYIIVEELRAEGFTDYLITPLVYLSGEVHCASWSCSEPEGFSDSAIEFIEKIRHPLARLTEIYMLRLNTAALLTTYIGRNAGEKVMAGQVKLGDGEDIEAVILFADIKGFTQLSNGISAKEVLAKLNLFFAAMEKPIRKNGGEILKFLGDGVLAIFPVTSEKDAAARIIEKAYQCLCEAYHKVEQESAGELEFRGSIHIGNIHYGNIGGENRLDFTAIGPSVNLAARILSAATDLGADFVCSKDVAGYLKSHTGKPSEFSAKGFDAPQLVYPLNLTEIS